MRLLAWKGDYGVCHPSRRKVIHSHPKRIQRESKENIDNGASLGYHLPHRTSQGEHGVHICRRQVYAQTEFASLRKRCLCLEKISLLGTGTVAIWSNREPIVSD